MEALQEHNDRLGALIADLQIKRANQVMYADCSIRWLSLSTIEHRWYWTGGYQSEKILLILFVLRIVDLVDNK